MSLDTNVLDITLYMCQFSKLMDLYHHMQGRV